MRKILIIGCSGVGKSTLAVQMGKKLSLPVHHLDRLLWLPGWVKKNQAVFDAEVEKLLTSNSWIMDGTFSRTLPHRLQFADTVVWLRYSRLLCAYRVLKRRWEYSGESFRPDMTPGCPEKMDWKFFHFIWNFHRKKEPYIIQDLSNAQRPSLEVIILRTPKETGRFFERIG